MSTQRIEDWMEKPLSGLLIDSFDGAWGEEANSGDGTPVIRSTEMRGGMLALEGVARRLIPARTVATKALRDGDILVNKSSGSSHLVGASVLFQQPSSNEIYLCSNFIRCLRPNETEISSLYLLYYLQSPLFREQVFSAQRTTSGLRNLNLAEYLAGVVRFPNLPEQCRIVARIREMMVRVEEIAALQAEATLEADAMFAPLVESQVEPDWPIVSLAEVTADIRNGWSGKTDDKGREVGVLRLSCVHGLTIDLSDTKAAKLSGAAIRDFQICERDVFLVRGNGSKHLVGRSAIAEESCGDVVFNDLLIRLQFNDSMLPEFGNLILHSAMARRQIEESAKTAAGIWKINQSGIRTIQVPCPERVQQEALVDRVAAMREVCDEIVAGVRSTPTAGIRQAILRKAFAGEM
jgi:type I restriction enzyme S subunit